MIIFGTREARLLTKVFDGDFCPYCGHNGTIACTVFSKHVHLFWIPFFPVGKRSVIWCTQCGHEFKHVSETAPVLQQQIANVIRSGKAPFWQWTGLLLMIALIANTLISGFRETKNTRLFMESPQVGDVYCVKYDDDYTLMSISSIENDSIFFIENKYTMSLKSRAKELHRDNFYDHDILYGYTHDELEELFEDKSILTIWRNFPYQTKKLDLTDEERKLLEEDGDNEEEDEYDAFMEKMYEDNEV
ncbi:MAG: zinc ribbon domain-containing protein, partial [Tannerella sp.]|nr:zinc ribbon domain-containing protein [Tannerella sp.]